MFPLGSVLFPFAPLPLHVFEPRYRALVADALASDGLLAIATVQSGYEADAHGAPPVHPELGVGKIVQHDRLPDGRSNLFLAHVASARLVRELPSSTAYRVVEAERTDGVPAPEAAVSGVRAMVLQLATASPDSGEEAARLASMPSMELVHALARRMFTTTDLQRLYLGLEDAVRVELVSDGLAQLLASTRPAGDA